MPRSVARRLNISDNVSWRQDQALNATMYILRETGPTAYLLQEDGESKLFKVLIGDPHSCTCPVFRKEKDLCKHICWVLLKKFKVPRHDQDMWQQGLVNRQVNELLRSLLTPQEAPRRVHTATTSGAAAEGQQCLKQRVISADDVCPICQDEFLAKHEPVTYCKFSCGNNVHIKCMKIWAEHQKSIGEPVIRCPMCRQDFGPYERLKQEYNNSSARDTRANRQHQHLGTTCNKCRSSPIMGKCYKCVRCLEMYLCKTCFKTDHHRQHTFVYRQKSSHRWRDVTRGDVTRCDVTGVLPSGVIRDITTREISEQDHDLLLQLDESSRGAAGDITEDLIKSLPCEKIRSTRSPLLQPGQQCRACLRGYKMGDTIRCLPCHHKFHVECIDDWLLHQRPQCPLDGQLVWSPNDSHAREPRRRNELREGGASSSIEHRGAGSSMATGQIPLEIPGIGLRPAMRDQSTNTENEGGVVTDDQSGSKRLFRGPPLTMTGSRITPNYRPDLFVGPCIGQEVMSNSSMPPPLGALIGENPTRPENHPLPPTGIRRAHQLANKPATKETSVSFRALLTDGGVTFTQLDPLPGSTLFYRRASDPSSLVPQRTPQLRPNSDDHVVGGLHDRRHLSRWPLEARASVSHDNGVRRGTGAATLRPIIRTRPHSDTSDATRANNVPEIRLTGHQVQPPNNAIHVNPRR